MKFDVKEWCLEYLDNSRLTSTNQIVSACPWCSKDGHFYVDADSGYYICFLCEVRGRHLVGLIAHVEGLDRREAYKRLMRNQVLFRRKETTKSLLDRIVSIRTNSSADDIVDFPLPKEFVPVFDGLKWRYPVYLKNRKIRRKTAKTWDIGWCRSGRYSGRVIMPIGCPNGRSFTARDVTGKQFPRYLNPSGVNHGKLLFGWEYHDIGGDVVLVEGPIDAIMMWQHGFSSLALMGKVLHNEQLLLLCKKPKDISITVLLDPEEIEAPYRIASQLIFRFDNIYIGKLPDGVDPGSSSKKQAYEACNNAKRYVGNNVNVLCELIRKSACKLDFEYDISK